MGRDEGGGSRAGVGLGAGTHSTLSSSDRESVHLAPTWSIEYGL